MLNFDTKKQSIERLQKKAARYERLGDTTKKDAVALHRLRTQTSAQVIGGAEAYVNRLANSPKSFQKSVATFRIAVDRFDRLLASVKVESHDATVKSGAMAGAAVGGAATVMAAGPAAAMAIATTFGTASTGTAISALSGAAATNAALAWLGGGALAAGGGGMAAGAKAMAILGGPVGWGLGGAALAGTAVWTHRKNAEIAKKASLQADQIQGRVKTLQAAREEIARLQGLTQQHADGALGQLDRLQREAPADYRAFSRGQKQELGALVNNIRSLGELLNKQLS